MDNYVHVGSIIEQERLMRQNQISKSVSDDITENIAKNFEKSECDKLNNASDLMSEVLEFKKSIEDSNLSKADTELYLHKIQRELTAKPNDKRLNQIRSVLINYKSRL